VNVRGFAIVVAVAAAGRPTWADDASAKVLFDQGKSLFAEGKYGDACAKLEASFELAALSSTGGMLGACYEKVGKLASAWAAYRDAAAIAARQWFGERASAARDKAAELEPKLARFAIDATAARVPGTALTITVDGARLPDAAVGEALPIDSGPHVIVVDARGYAAWHVTIDAVDGERSQLDVPALVADPDELEDTKPRSERTMSHGRKLAVGVVATGGVILAVAGAFAIIAKVDWNGADCVTDGDGVAVCPDAASKRKADAASRDANIATVLGIAGFGGVAVGAVMFALAPRYAPEEVPRITPVLHADGASLVINGRF
jgi:serine/threonine-protein kinase